MLFWMARRAVRSCTSRRRSSDGGAGCLVGLVAVVVISAIAGGGGAQAPVAGPHGWHQGADGVYIPDSPPIIYGTGGPDWAGPVQAPGPKPPAHATPVPAAPTPPAPTSNYWGLIGLAAAIITIGGLAIIGSRMTPKPILKPPKGGPPDFPPAEQLGGGGPPPDNPAKWSDRR